MDLAWSSKAALAIAPLQDLLNLGAESRMNVPGRPAGNWGWRCREDMLSPSPFEWLRNLTQTSKRWGASAGAQGRKFGKRIDASCAVWILDRNRWAIEKKIHSPEV
jgi:4-alpha-glucanotransferase